ncbi:MAG: hypothetical protein NVSMB70_13940 [Chamaesiphon sp.]
MGGSVGALVTPETLEDKRRRRLNELEARIQTVEANPELRELKEPLIAQHKRLASAEGTELRSLLLHLPQPPQQNALPPAEH